MAVYDRWHREPREDDVPCSCSRGRNKLYPSAVHLRGVRWQVRWDDPTVSKRRQPRKNFALRDPGPGELPDIEKHASAFDSFIQGKIVTRNYTDPNAGKVTLREFAEKLRKARRIPNPETAADLEGRLRNHVYEGEPGSGRTPMDAPSIGQHSMALLAAQPSLVAAWAAAIPLSPIRARHVMGDVSYCFRVAMDDNIVQRDPTQAQSVTWPRIGPTKARAWSLEQLEAMRAELAAAHKRYCVLLDIGAGAGLRQGEMLALGIGDVDWLVKDEPQVRVVRQLKFIEGRPHFAPLKNRNVHAAPLPESLKEALQRHLDEHPAVDVTLPWFDPEDRARHGKPVPVRLLVTTEARKPVLGNSLSNVWRDARRRAGITPDGESERADGCHALRHTYVSTQLRAGVDIVRVAAWIGDSVKTVVDTYAHFLPGGNDGDARAAVDAFFTPDSGGGSCAPGVPSAGENAT